MNNLKNIYTYLVGNNKHEQMGWYDAYSWFVDQVSKIKELLNTGLTLDDIDTYKNSSFAKSDKIANPKWSFLKKLFDNKSNGIASNGQSMVSNENFDTLFNSKDFVGCVAKLIIEPTLENHNELRWKWEEIVKKNNPVLTNRATSACTTSVSSAVDEGKFNQVFYWLQKEKLVSEYTGEQDWYSRNAFVVAEVRKALNEVETDPFWINIFIWRMYENLSNPFSLKKQIVKYGAPGTGKTFISNQTAKLQFDIWKSRFAPTETFQYADMKEVVQFHPSYSYEDFLEGFRPTIKGNLTLHNGLFKSFCKMAGRWEVDIANLELNVKKLSVGDAKELANTLPGRKYWDFIFKLDKSYDLTPLIDVLPPYFLIIDEINRAELSRVFGELMYCLEYRGVEGAVKTQYAHLNDGNTGMIQLGEGYQFFVPNNVYILATMNTIDRSVDSFDFALRRRFKWEEVLPDMDLLRYHYENPENNEGSEKYSKWIDLVTNLESLNEEISKEPLLGNAYCIGHAYLWTLPYSKDNTVQEVRKLIWNDSIRSLLEEYLRGTGKEEDLLRKFSSAFGL